MIRRVVSGGQTGVDRAGLDAALGAGIIIGGYCPRGRTAEDGVIPERYPMTELESPESYYRTEKNVIDSDGTLILNKGEITEGTRLTLDFAIQYGRPCLTVQLDEHNPLPPDRVVRWLRSQYIQTLNIAGPRESKCPGGIYHEALEYLQILFGLLKAA